MSFQVIREYTAGRTQGFVYSLNGRRAASFAKSLEALKTSLGVKMEERVSGDLRSAVHAGDLRLVASLLTGLTGEAQEDHELNQALYAQALQELVHSMSQSTDAGAIIATKELVTNIEHPADLGFASVGLLKPKSWGAYEGTLHERVAGLWKNK